MLDGVEAVEEAGNRVLEEVKTGEFVYMECLNSQKIRSMLTPSMILWVDSAKSYSMTISNIAAQQIMV